MAKSGRRFFIVQEDLLPEAMIKTVLAKEMLLKGEAATVNEAVERVDLSRSAFYKYRDGVFPFYRWSPGVTVTLALVLEHRSGVLSSVLNTLAAARANILTINQNIPVHGLADVTVTFETDGMEDELEDVTARLRTLDGVREVKPLGHNVG
ncbi:MAG: ACT domain-containing protein [Peptococcaceae bacterium]|nr:ACT domain-containing protein [Peptococcaceae bacterium]